ncbi:MAG TPA: right-handed parallel beta-helix repeat-containing protein, partial [Planctomycetota bacterium]|nr:right-handed parallel beta-helix repeat-containing protein [Planctomycetota bacterium]
MKKPTNVRVAFVLAFILSPAVHAATWHVRAGASGDGSAEVTDFYVNDAVAEEGFWPGDNANSGTAPDAPMASIGALLDRYPEIGEGCTIHVAPGVYQENLYIGPDRSGLVLAGAGPGVSIIDGAQQASCVVLDCPAAVIDGFTIRNGKGLGMGGGIACLSGSPVIINNHITGNSFLPFPPNQPAAAISCFSSSPLIVQNVVADNTLSPYACGGLCCIDSPAMITANTFARNSSRGGGYAGAIQCTGESAPVVIGNEITGNKAYEAAGILSSAPIVISSNVISDNASSTSHGWSSAVLCSAAATITDNTFAGNEVTAITCENCEVNITGNTIRESENGIYATNASGSVQNNTITANGTGIDWTGSGTISHNTFTGNTDTAIHCVGQK